MTRRKLFCS